MLFLIFLIYAVLGVFIFKDVKTGKIIDEFNNFSNFGYAMLILFRCATGEDWYVIMFDLFKTSNCTYGVDCGNSIYFNKINYFNEY